MRSFLCLSLLVACSDEPPLSASAPVPPTVPVAPPGAAAPLAHEPAVASPSSQGCPPVDGQARAQPSEQRIPLGERALVVETCPHHRGATAVRAQLEGGTWSWEGDYVYDAASFEYEMNHYAFELVGALGHGGFALAQRYVTCDLDGCDRVRFYRVDPVGTVRLIADDTIATSWEVGPRGTLRYVERTGYSMGYHIASAAWTYRWDGRAFVRQPKPTLAAEYAAWPCPDGEVQPVDPATGEATGAPIPLSQGAPIEVLAVDPEQPGSLFEYRVGGQRFWAKNWTQTCAG